MVELIAAELVSLWPNLDELKIGWALGGKDTPNAEELQRVLGRLEQIANSLNWKELAGQSRRLHQRARDAGISDESKRVLAEELITAFEDKLADVRLVLVDEKDTAILTNASREFCGQPLHADLSVSEEEFNLAGRALAVGLSTAAVSHAMRSIEASLYAMCRALPVTFPGTIELQDWVNLTEKIKGEIDKLQQQPRSPHKTEQQKKMSELMIPADGFRLAWRNHVAHPREKYEDAEARRVLAHAGEFLKRLSDTL